MKKLLTLFAVAALCFGLCGPGSARDAFTDRLLASTTLDDDPTQVISSGIDISQYERVAIWVTYDETQVGLAIEAEITFDISYDNSTFVDVEFLDVAGGVTLQSTETINSDSTFVAWIHNNNNAPYLRISIVATNTDDDDTLVVSATISAQK